MRGCCNGVASQEKEIIYDQHNAASPLYSFFKQPIINTLKKFYFKNIRLRFLNLFLLEHRLLEDVFLGAPSEDRPQQTECIWRILCKSSFGSFFLAAFLKKRISTLITTGKQHKVLIRSWRNASDVYSLEAHLEVIFLLCSLRNAHRRWLRLENNTKF